jgi:hypothetical protein
VQVDFGDIFRRHEAGEIDQAEKEALLDMAREGMLSREPMDPKPEPQGVVYYIKTCCRIKIGFTVDLPRRMRELGPDELLATEQGTPSVERKRHDQFSEYRIRGEWFRESPALAAHIMALKARHHSADTGFAGERMINTASAQAWTGRDRQVLYRWAREGRITRYGTPQEALWDIFELPARRADGKLPDPPPKRS